MADRKIVAEFSVTTEEGRKNLERLKEAMVAFGDAGTQAAPEVTNNLENIGRALESVEKKLVSGRVVTTRDVGLMAQQFALLEDRITEAFGSLDKAPPQLQAAFAKVQTEIGQTVQKVGGLTNAVSDNAAGVKLASGVWPGFSAAVEQVGKKIGVSTAEFVTFTLALRESYRIFRDVADFAGVDQGEATKVVGELKSRVQALNTALVEASASAFNLNLALQLGEADQAKTAIQELATEAAKLAGSWSSSEKEAASFNAMIAAGVPFMTAYTTSMNEHAQVADLWAKYQAAGTDGIKAFQAILKEHPEDIAGAIKALKEWETNLDSLKKTTDEVSEAEKRRMETVKEAMSLADQVIAKMEAEREARRLGMDDLEKDILALTNYKKALEDAATSADMAIRVKDGLSESMRLELQAILELLPAWQDHTSKLDAFAEALERDIALYADGLSPAQEKQLKEIAEIIQKYEAATPVEREHTKQLIEKALKTTEAAESTIKLTGSLADGTAKMTNAAAEAGKAAVKYDELTKTISNVKTAADEQASAVGSFGEKLTTQEAALQAYESRLNGLAIAFSAIAMQARSAASAIEAVGIASGQAAGVDHGAGVVDDIPGHPGEGW